MIPLSLIPPDFPRSWVWLGIRSSRAEDPLRSPLPGRVPRRPYSSPQTVRSSTDASPRRAVDDWREGSGGTPSDVPVPLVHRETVHPNPRRCSPCRATPGCSCSCARGRLPLLRRQSTVLYPFAASYCAGDVPKTTSGRPGWAVVENAMAIDAPDRAPQKGQGWFWRPLAFVLRMFVALTSPGPAEPWRTPDWPGRQSAPRRQNAPREPRFWKDIGWGLTVAVSVIAALVGLIWLLTELG